MYSSKFAGVSAASFSMKIVVRGTNWVGDAVMTIPALERLRRLFPDAEITLHTRSWARGIFRDADFIDNILSFEANESSFKTVLKQAKIWREKKFDLAVLLTNSFESALLAKLGNAKIRFGYAKEARSFLLTDSVKIPVWKNERHEVFYYLNLIDAIERKYSGETKQPENRARIDLNVSDARKQTARKFLENNGVNLSKPIVAFGVGSTNSRAKRWQPESFARLNDRIQMESNSNVILIGAADELEISMNVFEKSAKKPIVLTGKTDLSEIVAVLSEIDLLVANDMGLAHIAPAVGAKTLVIFGPTNPRTTRPFSENAEIIYKNVECSPCMLRDCPIDHRCMTRISADEVYQKAEEFLSAAKHE